MPAKSIKNHLRSTSPSCHASSQCEKLCRLTKTPVDRCNTQSDSFVKSPKKKAGPPLEKDKTRRVRTRTQFKKRDALCIASFWSHKKPVRDPDTGCCRLCSKGAHQNQLAVKVSPPICDEACDSRIIKSLEALPETEKAAWLAHGNNSLQKLKFRVSPPPKNHAGPETIELESKEFDTIDITFSGPFDTINEPLVERIDKLALRFAPKIQGKDATSRSIPLAILGIGYTNMLWWVRIEDQSRSPSTRHHFSSIFTRFILKRIDALISSGLSSARTGGGDIAEARPGIVLWYLFLSQTHKLLEDSGHCRMFNDKMIFEHLMERLRSIGEELRVRLETDCRHKVKYFAAFKATQTQLSDELGKGMKEWALSLDLFSSSHGALSKSGNCGQPYQLVDSEKFTGRADYGEGSKNANFLPDAMSNNFFSSQSPMSPSLSPMQGFNHPSDSSILFCGCAADGFGLADHNPIVWQANDAINSRTETICNALTATSHQVVPEGGYNDAPGINIDVNAVDGSFGTATLGTLSSSTSAHAKISGSPSYELTRNYSEEINESQDIESHESYAGPFLFDNSTSSPRNPNNFDPFDGRALPMTSWDEYNAAHPYEFLHRAS